MKKILFALAMPLSMFLLISACNDPTVIGSELLEQDEADLAFVDTLTLIAQTVAEDTVVTYTIDNQFNNFPCGYFEDPVFGTIRSTIYSQFKEGALDPPAFENPQLDSLVLLLGFDTTAVYGVFDEAYQLEVRRITEDLDNSQEFYSNQSFETESDVLGMLNFEPNPLAIDSMLTFVGGDSIPGFFIRIRLDDQLGLDMLDESWYEEGAFVEMMKGLEIKLANTMPTNGLLSFSMNSTFTRLRLFYTNYTSEPDTISTVYDFTVSGSTTPRHANMVHDFTGTEVEQYFNNPEGGDSLLFMQGMSGPNISIEIPYIRDLGDIVVNKAEMDFYVAELPGDDIDVYEPIGQLVTALQEEGEFVITSDVILNPTAFGGNLTTESIDGLTLQKYTINLAAYLNSTLLEDETSSIQFFLRAFPKQETTKRVVIYGPKHPLYPAKLKLTYTSIDN